VSSSGRYCRWYVLYWGKSDGLIPLSTLHLDPFLENRDSVIHRGCVQVELGA